MAAPLQVLPVPLKTSPSLDSLSSDGAPVFLSSAVLGGSGASRSILNAGDSNAILELLGTSSVSLMFEIIYGTRLALVLVRHCKSEHTFVHYFGNFCSLTVRSNCFAKFRKEIYKRLPNKNEFERSLFASERF